MKLLKSFAAVAMITTALTGTSYAVYNAADQANNQMADLKDVGYAGPKKLSLTRAGVEAVYADVNPLDPTLGAADPVKNAKAFLKGILDGTIAKFDGADAPTKKGAFLTALDAAIVKAGTPALEVDVNTTGFNPGVAPAADKITLGVDALYEAVKPVAVNPRVAALAQAKAIGIKTPTGEALDALEAELASGDPARVTAANEAIDALKFGKAGDRDLAAQTAHRLAKHDAAKGEYKDLGLAGNDARIKAFHDILEADRAKRTGGTSGDAAFANQVKELFANGIVEGDASSPEAMLASLQSLATQLSEMSGELARVKKAGGVKVVQSGEHARAIPVEHDLGSGQYKGGMNF